MAEVTKFAVPISGTPRAPASLGTPFCYRIAVVSGDGPNADFISVFTPPVGAVIGDLQIGHSATLGASCTIQGRLGTTALTAASTAGGASRVRQNAAAGPANGTDTLNLLVGGAAITASATIEVSGVYYLPN